MVFDDAFDAAAAVVVERTKRNLKRVVEEHFAYRLRSKSSDALEPFDRRAEIVFYYCRCLRLFPSPKTEHQEHCYLWNYYCFYDDDGGAVCRGDLDSYDEMNFLPLQSLDPKKIIFKF
jgi:hypothetical protein